MTDDTATGQMIDHIQRTNLRQRRAIAMTASVMRSIEPYLDNSHDRVRRNAYEALMSLFTEQGVDVFTDYDRKEIGLPPRGDDGWTAEEIIAMERIRMETLLRPISFMMDLPKDHPLVSPEYSARRSQLAKDSGLGKKK